VRAIDAVGDDRDDRLADEARAIGGERPDAARHREGRMRRVDRHRLAGPTEVGGGEDADDTRRAASRRHVDRADARMRVGRAHHRRVEAAENAQVVDELASPRDEPRVLAAANRSGVLGHASPHRRSCALQAVAGLGPRRPRRAYKFSHDQFGARSIRRTQ